MGRGLRRAAGPVSFFLCMALSACATAPADKGVETPDPLESMNRAFFAFNDTLDKAVLGPVSRGYVKVTPQPARDGIRNFFDNLGYGVVVVNEFLQGKIENGFEGILRIVFNSTFGLGGLVDFSGKVGLQPRDEDYGQTLAVWGVGPGVYLELPFFGPSTLRDAFVLPASMVSRPLFYAEPEYSIPLGAVDVIDFRSRLETAIKLRDETALDPYIFQRDAWLQRRRSSP